MKKAIVLTIGVALASLLALASGCRSVGYEPIPAKPIAVQSVVGASVQPVVPIPETTGPVATSVAGVEVWTEENPAPSGPKTKAVLIVQNHTGHETTPFALSTLGDWLQTALNASDFAVVNPHDVIGTEQNTSPWGEKMPESSATRLAENLDAPVLITASVTSVRVREIGGTSPGWQAILGVTLAAKAVPGGESLASVTSTARSKKEASELAFRQKAENTWSEVAKAATSSAAKALRSQYEKAVKSGFPGLKTVQVAFSANVAGANVRIDGISFGTVGGTPKSMAVTKGVHNLEVAYPGLVGFKDVARIQENATFAIVLALTPEGEAARKKDQLFAALMDRMEKSGATDDLVRELTAKGYNHYLQTSFTQLQVQGMPQAVTLQNSPLPSLGFPSGELDVPAGPSTEQLIDRAKKLTE